MLSLDFPEIITSLPEAEIAFDGVRGWIAQGDNHQMVFFEISQSAVVPEHSHNAQWGIVVEGEMELTIDGRVKIYKKGDEYFITQQGEEKINIDIPAMMNESMEYLPHLMESLMGSLSKMMKMEVFPKLSCFMGHSLYEVDIFSDEKISVYITDLSKSKNLPIGTFKQNVRYCNDKEDCIEKVKTFSFFKND